jgi:type IV pilus assembly protein PilC
MKTYQYTAFEARGKQVKDTLEAADFPQALERLRDLGLYPLQVKEVTPAPEVWAGVRARSRSSRFPVWQPRVSAKSLASFTRQLATMVEAGLPLLRGLRLLEEQEDHRHLKRTIADIGASIEAGDTFTEALSAHPRVFNHLYVNMVRAGEVGGILDLSLRRLAEFMEKAQKIKGKVVAAMFYPAAVLLIALVILSCLMVFIVPRFQAVFSDLLGPTHQMPLFTRFVLGLSQSAASHFPLVLAVLALGAFGFVALGRTRAGRSLYDQGKLGLPVLGPVVRKVVIARFTRTLGTLLNSGVPILQALMIVRDTSGNSVVARAVEAIHAGVKEGDSIARPMAASRTFPATVVGMVDVGEQTGALPTMLLKVADIYDDEVDSAIAALTSLLEPLMIVLLAMIVGSIVVALFLPLIDILNDLTAPATSVDG